MLRNYIKAHWKTPANDPYTSWARRAWARARYFGTSSCKTSTPVRGVGLLDPHGNLAREVLDAIPRGRTSEVLHFNPGDLARPVGLNLLPKVAEALSLALPRPIRNIGQPVMSSALTAISVAGPVALPALSGGT